MGIRPIENVEEKEKEEEASKPKAICGVILMRRFNGTGIDILPIPEQNNEVERGATPDDIISLISSAYMHISSNVTADKVIKFSAKFSKKMKGLI